MKKIICVFAICMLLFNTCVNAASLGDMTKKVVKYFGIEVTDDLSGISKLQNRRNLSDPSLVSTAVINEILVAEKGLINEAGTDYTPLINGLIKKYIKDDGYKFVTGTQVELERNKNVVINNKTFCLVNGELNYNDLYTCIVDKKNVAIFIWNTTEIRNPSLYKVKLYWMEEDELIMTEFFRKEYGDWIKESQNKLYSFNAPQISMDNEFVMNNIDKYIYVFADNYGSDVIIKGISD